MNTLEQTLVPWCTVVSIFCITLTSYFLYVKVVWLSKYVTRNVIPENECTESQHCKKNVDKYNLYLKISFFAAFVSYIPLLGIALVKYLQ